MILDPIEQAPVIIGNIELDGPFGQKHPNGVSRLLQLLDLQGAPEDFGNVGMGTLKGVFGELYKLIHRFGLIHRLARLRWLTIVNTVIYVFSDISSKAGQALSSHHAS